MVQLVRLGRLAGGLSSAVPANAVRDRAAAVVRDRAGSIIVTRG